MLFDSILPERDFPPDSDLNERKKSEKSLYSSGLDHPQIRRLHFPIPFAPLYSPSFTTALWTKLCSAMTNAKDASVSASAAAPKSNESLPNGRTDEDEEGQAMVIDEEDLLENGSLADEEGIEEEFEEAVAGEEGLYQVERILAKRVQNGVVEYLIKWDGFPDSDNTWEPRDHLDCRQMMEDFDRMATARAEQRKRQSEEPRRGRPNPAAFEAEDIIGATDSSGELMFLMKWKGRDQPDLVPARQANVKCPKLVIKFFERRLKAAENIESSLS